MPVQDSANNRITIRFTDAQLAVISVAADAQSLPKSTYLKRTALKTAGVSYRPRVRAITKNDAQHAHVIGALGRIGNNVNQLAHAANTHQLLDENSIRDLVSEMRQLRSRLAE